MPTVGLLAAAASLAGCGGNLGNKQAAAATVTKLPITATEAGKQLRLTVPKSVPAGLVTVELTNAGKAFHEAQLIRLAPGHTPEDAMKVIAAEGSPSPGWIHVAGGTGPAPPGGKRSATQRLRPGNYIVYDAPFQNEGSGLKFGLASFKVEGEANSGRRTANGGGQDRGVRVWLQGLGTEGREEHDRVLEHRHGAAPRDRGPLQARRHAG